MKNFDWEHENGGKEVTKGIRLETTAQAGDIITVLYPGNVAPFIKNLPDGNVTHGSPQVFVARCK